MTEKTSVLRHRNLTHPITFKREICEKLRRFVPIGRFSWHSDIVDYSHYPGSQCEFCRLCAWLHSRPIVNIQAESYVFNTTRRSASGGSAVLTRLLPSDCAQEDSAAANDNDIDDDNDDKEINNNNNNAVVNINHHSADESVHDDNDSTNHDDDDSTNHDDDSTQEKSTDTTESQSHNLAARSIYLALSLIAAHSSRSVECRG